MVQKMNEFEFAIWLSKHNVSKKLCSDYVSRLKQLERSLLDCNLEDEYYKNKCSDILLIFKNEGRNEKMASLHIGNLPIGKPYLSAYKYALNKYICYMNETSINA